MADYTQSKAISGQLMPANAVDSDWQRNEPLIDADGIRNRILWGVSLVSSQTGQEMPDEVISDIIQDSVAELEEETQLQIFPTEHNERYEFDRHLYQSMGYLQLRQRPVHSIERFSILTSNEMEIWAISLDWIDSGYLHQGRVYIVPINVAVSPSSSSGGAAGGAAFLAIIGQQPWVPAFWKIKYTTGFPDKSLPRAVNLLIGYQAGINILIKLAAANAKSQSKSLSIDGLGQSTSNAGPAIYEPIIERLEKQKKKLVGKIKDRMGLKFVTGSI